LTDILQQTRRWLEQERHFLLDVTTDDYPDLLRGLDDRPDALYVAGDLDALHLPAIAIVGSRNPTRGGLECAHDFARHLARAGFTIVSGLAQGIDTAAHRGAIDGGGRTIAVLGHGIDIVYPDANRDLADTIVGHGALVSEFPLGTPPRRQNFPARNRIISGLSIGTLVVEAARRSGSLITARLAGEQGREVFAIPGSIHNPLAKGCHQLIRQGAKLVDSVDDIVAELRPLTQHLMQNRRDADDPARPPTRDPEYQRLLDVLAFDPVSAEELAERAGLTIGQVSSMLLILELEGEIESLPGGRFSRVSTT